jgi:hypothetical protein
MLIVAEIGAVERFPSARHLCAWAGLTPMGDPPLGLDLVASDERDAPPEKAVPKDGPIRRNAGDEWGARPKSRVTRHGALASVQRGPYPAIGR